MKEIGKMAQREYGDSDCSHHYLMSAVLRSVNHCREQLFGIECRGQRRLVYRWREKGCR